MRIPATITQPHLRPTKAHPGDAGIDLRAAEAGVLEPGRRALIPTGLKLALPHGWEAQVRPRSGLALHHGITVLNSPGTIDAGYHGEICVIAINLDPETPWAWEEGDRIAQLVIKQVPYSVLDIGDVLPDRTSRGVNGFGSTGVSA